MLFCSICNMHQGGRAHSVLWPLVSISIQPLKWKAGRGNRGVLHVNENRSHFSLRLFASPIELSSLRREVHILFYCSQICRKKKVFCQRSGYTVPFSLNKLPWTEPSNNWRRGATNSSFWRAGNVSTFKLDFLQRILRRHVHTFAPQLHWSNFDRTLEFRCGGCAKR